ncbi:MAG TPA: 4-alpha-glucanotransferase [Bryobacteraceae bacterium]
MHISLTLPRDLSAALRQAAGLWGIEAEYYDIWGRHHVVSDEVIASILATLGVWSGSLEELQHEIVHRMIAEWGTLAPATIVVFEDSVKVPLHIRAGGQHDVEAIVHLEDGSSKTLSANAIELEATADIDGIHYERRILEFSALPLGYHRLELRTAAATATVNLIVCPRCAYTPEALRHGGKSSGLSISLYGLRSERNWGCGDFTDLETLVEWAARNELGFVALNPLHAIPNRQPYNTSPYLPTSILYRNLLYLDVAAVEDSKHIAEPNAAAELRATPFVEYERVYKLKRKALRAAFRRFLANEWRHKTTRAGEFQQYLDNEGDSLRRFAIYCALDEWIHRENPNIWLWTDWPSSFQNPRSPEVEEFARKHWRMIRFYQYAQWQVDLQLARVQARTRELHMPIGLYHDLALATDRTGADVWAHPEFYMKGCRVGSPPDDFSPDGQDWAFPPPNTRKHFDTGYRLFAEGIRKTARHGGALRIDHVMRLFRLFWIPDGQKATAGAYVRDRAADLMKILALESVRGQMLVVGEDLGTVSDETRAALKNYGILSYRLFFFERYGDGRYKQPGEYPAQALASTTTHDLPTLAGFWSGHDIDVRRAVGLIKDDASYNHQRATRLEEKRRMAEALHLPWESAERWTLDDSILDAVIGFMASTPCTLFCLNQEDLTKSEEQLNLPGTTFEHPNWRRKMRYALEQLDSNPDAMRVTQMVREWLRRTGRA